MNQYKQLVKDVLSQGTKRQNRTNHPTYSLFGTQTRYPLADDAFPLLTTKYVNFDAVKSELFWFLRGQTNTKQLKPVTKIWDAWADDNGDLGPIYGKQWVNWEPGGINQIQNAIDLIKTDPMSRRIVVSAWNPSDLSKMALPPCHMIFQFYVTDDKRLSCHLYQRSADLALGVPFNIASYALLTYLIAHETELGVGEFVHTIGDAHVYERHVDGLLEQLHRRPKPLPRIELTPNRPFFKMTPNDVNLIGYDYHPAIKFEVAI